ncbi:hypothetical protein M2275_002637 [Rhodococcus opacus]|nr:hypothetical protein [Rhodococcus opacus]
MPPSLLVLDVGLLPITSLLRDRRKVGRSRPRSPTGCG